MMAGLSSWKPPVWVAMLTCMPFARCRGGQLAQQQEEEEEARKREERRQQKKQAEEAEQKAREEEARAARMAKQVRQAPHVQG